MLGLHLGNIVGLDFQEPLQLNWSTIKLYNTIMAIGAGAGLAMIAQVMRDLIRGTDLRPRGWSINFLVTGLIVFITGIHMVLTWSLAPSWAYDNIIFGEPMTMLGVILLGLARYFHVRAKDIEEAEHPKQLIAGDLIGMRYLLYGAGGSLIAIALAALRWQLFIAPKEEPIAGLTAEWGTQWMTNVPLAAMWIGIGLCAWLVPNMMQRHATPDAPVTSLDKGVMTALKYFGIALVFIGAFVTFTHIGMVINTAPPDTLLHYTP